MAHSDSVAMPRCCAPYIQPDIALDLYDFSSGHVVLAKLEGMLTPGKSQWLPVSSSSSGLWRGSITTQTPKARSRKGEQDLANPIPLRLVLAPCPASGCARIGLDVVPSDCPWQI